MKLQLILLDDLFYRGTGPTGPQGPVSIAVGVTTTTDPGTNASVNNVGTDDNVILNFNIPRGETGPAGPTAIETYGRKYNTSTDNISLETNLPTLFELTLQELGINHRRTRPYSPWQNGKVELKLMEKDFIVEMNLLR